LQPTGCPVLLMMLLMLMMMMPFVDFGDQTI
jgi:hypothetical protein